MNDDINSIEEDEHEIVKCVECGLEFDNWEDGFFFPSGDEAFIPAKYRDQHYCNDCGYDIAEQYSWWK